MSDMFICSDNMHHPLSGTAPAFVGTGDSISGVFTYSWDGIVLSRQFQARHDQKTIRFSVNLEIIGAT